MDHAFTLDLIASLSSIEDVQSAYTDLGEAIHLSSTLSMSSSSELRKKAEAVLSAVVRSSDADTPDSVQRELDSLDALLKSTSLTGRRLSAAWVDLGNSANSAGVTSSVDLEIKMPSNQPALQSIEKAQSMLDRHATSLTDSLAKHSKFSISFNKTMIKEGEGLKRSIAGVAKRIPGIGAAAGGFVAGLIAILTVSTQERLRKQQEMGEMQAQFTQGVESVTSEGVRSAAEFFGNWAEKSSKFYGVGRMEVVETVNTLLRHGFTSSQMRKQFNAELGEVGDNIVFLALGLSKNFNASSADSIESITSMVEDYGYSLREAGRNYEGLHVSGIRAGFGVRKFVDAALRASGPLVSWGININTVANVIGNISNHFKSIGMNNKYAGGQAMQVAEDMMTALSNTSDGYKLMIARRMNKGTTMTSDELLVQLKDGMDRVSKGDDDAFLEEYLKAVMADLDARGAGGRSVHIRDVQAIFGANNRLASVIVDAGRHVADGGRLADASKVAQMELRASFDTEGTSVNRLEKSRRLIIEGVSELGEGIMATLISILTTIIIGVKSLGAIAQGMKNNSPIELGMLALGALSFVGGSFATVAGVVMAIPTMGGSLSGAVAGSGVAAGGLATMAAVVGYDALFNEDSPTPGIIRNAAEAMQSTWSDQGANNKAILGGLEKIGTGALETIAPQLDENIVAPLTEGQWGVRTPHELPRVTPTQGVNTTIGGTPHSDYSPSSRGGGSGGDEGAGGGLKVIPSNSKYKLQGSSEDRPFFFKVDPGLMAGIARALNSGEVKAQVVQ